MVASDRETLNIMDAREWTVGRRTIATGTRKCQRSITVLENIGGTMLLICIEWQSIYIIIRIFQQSNSIVASELGQSTPCLLQSTAGWTARAAAVYRKQNCIDATGYRLLETQRKEWESCGSSRIFRCVIDVRCSRVPHRGFGSVV